jgi:hypothetical protein
MSYSMKVRRSLVLIGLVLVMSAISAPSAQAASLGWQQLAGGLGQGLSAWLDSIVPGLHRVQPKSSCGIDPNGNTLCQGADSSCSIDPKGSILCQPITPKHGCGIDPNGVTHCEP